MQVIWNRLAARQLSELHEYIARDSRQAADRQLLLVYHAAESLSLFPEKGRGGRIDGTRELVVISSPYIVAYRIRNSSVRILAIIHGSRRWPRSFPEN